MTKTTPVTFEAARREAVEIHLAETMKRARLDAHRRVDEALDAFEKEQRAQLDALPESRGHFDERHGR